MPMGVRKRGNGGAGAVLGRRGVGLSDSSWRTAVLAPLCAGARELRALGVALAAPRGAALQAVQRAVLQCGQHVCVAGVVVRLRGLPYQASDHEVARFFRGLNIVRYELLYSIPLICFNTFVITTVDLNNNI